MPAGKLSAARSGDDRVQIRMHDVVVRIEHLQDRRACGSRAADRINCVVVEHRMTAGRRHRRSVGVLLLREPQVQFCYLAAIPFRAARFDVHRTKQPHRQRTAIALSTGCRSSAVEQVVAFFFGVKRVDDAVARSDQTARIGSDI